MSEGEYQYQYMLPDENLDEEILWKTRDGTILKIADMTIDHLQNAVDFLVRKDSSNPKLQELRDEIERRR